MSVWIIDQQPSSWVWEKSERVVYSCIRFQVLTESPRRAVSPHSFLTCILDSSPSPHAAILPPLTHLSLSTLPSVTTLLLAAHKRKPRLHVIDLGQNVWKYRHFQDLMKFDLFGLAELGLSPVGKGRVQGAEPHQVPSPRLRVMTAFVQFSDCLHNNSHWLGFTTWSRSMVVL